MAGAFLCVLRARFFLLEVRRFGTAIVSGSLRWFDGLVCVALMLEQRAPARFGLGWRAVAGALVQVGAACGAESFAILLALNVCRSGQQPRLSHRRAEVQHPRVRIVQE